ncbi:cytochrome P450 [Lentinus tigrinus ALCF2SS1-7]|uniref:Cytochrome P450 n=1 Tax=Lentinus tigrinus ALCF2SS1-6 TaxID=1328759 RepID=A0A5C2S7C5_9APHY|nr:cytochrome P450 [Lentinus tigrinus ALCF2SS1-6]RPD73457.1 cytochrome P450 [Lentinus tigrinus ALCF2SS1-7]
MAYQVSPVAFLALAALVFVVVVRASRRKSLHFLRGPDAPSRLLGNEHQLFHQSETGYLDFKWMREYGSTWRIRTFFGAEQIMTADPKALQHILQKSSYNYPKRIDMNTLTFLQLGPGILWAEGSMHQRHRKVMNPAFSAQQLRTFIPLFQRTAAKVIEQWKAQISEKSDGVVLVNKSLARGALDIVGQAAFDYNFGALDDMENPLAKEYSTMIHDLQLYPTPFTMLYRNLWRYMPQSVRNLIKYTPMHAYRRMRNLNEMFKGIGRPLYHSNTADGIASREGKRDVMSVLMKANNSENAGVRLGEEEVLAQMHHLTAAGQETTSSTLSWMLYELSKHPDYQVRIREEIRAVRALVVERGDVEFTPEDLDSMKYTLAAIKETLRFHPIAYHMWRYAGKDDVIPLSDPVTAADGTVITDIPVSAGQPIIISICGYNRLPHVWGDDADQWNPERFFRLDSEKQVKVGVYANLMSFSAGVRACIGWRFALYQLQAVAAELLETFDFSLPDDTPYIKRAPAGVMVPIVEGKEELGPAMPLRVSLAPVRV